MTIRVVAALALSLVAASCAGLVVASNRYYVMDAHDAIAMVASGSVAAIVDLRPSDAYSAGHIPGALSIPLSQLWIREDELPSRQGALIVIYEDDASRAERGATFLKREGYYDVHVIRGGFRAWIGAGGAVSDEPAAAPGTGEGVETWGF